MVFSDFFDFANIYGIRRPGIYSPFRDSANRQKAKFEIRKRVSFGWSNASSKKNLENVKLEMCYQIMQLL